MSIQLPITQDDLQHARNRNVIVSVKAFAVKAKGTAATILEPLCMLLQAVNRRLSKILIMKVPLMYLINILLFVFLLTNFIPKYSTLYAKNRFTTTLMSNLLLFGLADSLAQTLTKLFAPASASAPMSLDGPVSVINSTVPESAVRNAFFDEPQEGGFLIFADYGDEDEDLEGELDNHSILSQASSVYARAHVVIFDYPRLAGFMLWGFFISFFQFTWYIILNDLYVDDPKFVTVLERVLADQLFYSPISLAGFFYYSSTVLEGGDKYTFEKKIRKVYLSTLAANYSLWPAIQFINFLVMPKQYQVPFSSSVGVLWNCFLSIRNAQSK